AARHPGVRRQEDRAVREHRSTSLAQSALSRTVEARDIRTTRTHALGERRPPVGEVSIRAARAQIALLDVGETSRLEQLREVAFTRPGEVRLVDDTRSGPSSGFPERPERTAIAPEVPDACGHDAATPRHAGHLVDPGYRVGHEVDD